MGHISLPMDPFASIRIACNAFPIWGNSFGPELRGSDLIVSRFIGMHRVDGDLYPR